MNYTLVVSRENTYVVWTQLIETWRLARATEQISRLAYAVAYSAYIHIASRVRFCQCCTKEKTYAQCYDPYFFFNKAWRIYIERVYTLNELRLAWPMFYQEIRTRSVLIPIFLKWGGDLWKMKWNVLLCRNMLEREEKCKNLSESIHRQREIL